MKGNNVWSFGNQETGTVSSKSWFKNANKNIETIQYGKRKPVQSDLFNNVMDISRYVEYIDHGNMKSGILLIEYYTEPIERILQRYQNKLSAYCYLVDESNNFLYHLFAYVFQDFIKKRLSLQHSRVITILLRISIMKIEG